jgi:hypothetical protein
MSHVYKQRSVFIILISTTNSLHSTAEAIQSIISKIVLLFIGVNINHGHKTDDFLLDLLPPSRV